MTKIAVVSMVKAPLHELLMFVNYHLNIGIDEIILFFEDPHDPGLEALSTNTKVTCIPCSAEHWSRLTGDRPDTFCTRQLANVNEGARIAVDNGCDWIIQIDSDELIKPSGDLHQLLEKCDADVLRFQVLEAVSEKDDYSTIFATTLFKKESGKRRIKVAQKLGCKRAIFKNEYFRGHTASKMAVRPRSEIHIHGVHGPREFKAGSLSFSNTSEISLLHFDCVGFEAWNTKWGGRYDGTCKFVRMRENREEQLQNYGQEKHKGHDTLVNLYRRFQVIPRREIAVLTLLGMLQRVKLDQSLFKSIQTENHDTHA